MKIPLRDGLVRAPRLWRHSRRVVLADRPRAIVQNQPRTMLSRRSKLILGRIGLLLALSIAWQFIPQIGTLHGFALFDPFFISSPSRIIVQIGQMMTGTGGEPLIWPYLAHTVVASLIGTVAGTLLGGGLGLILSSYSSLSDFLMPFVHALNNVPRIALIPIVLIIFGPTLLAASVTALMVVFFIVFFNAFVGGRSVPTHVLQNAQILGATRMTIMREVRLPLSFAWTVAALPNAVSFGLAATVTAELLIGTMGVGQLLEAAVASASSTLTFAAVIFLAVTGWLMVSLASRFSARWLHWWEGSMPS